jgi:hypothetical protein
MIYQEYIFIITFEYNIHSIDVLIHITFFNNENIDTNSSNDYNHHTLLEVNFNIAKFYVVFILSEITWNGI